MWIESDSLGGVLRAAGYPCRIKRCIRVMGVWYAWV